jgi:uncharacterized protein
MGKDEALRRLRERACAIRGMGATALYLFGSTARDEAREASDLDLFVDYDHDSRFSAIELLRIKHHLSDTLAIEADVTTRDGHTRRAPPPSKEKVPGALSLLQRCASTERERIRTSGKPPAPPAPKEQS